MDIIMRLIYTLFCFFLLSSCTVGFYDADYDRDPYTICSNGTYGDNRECETEMKQLKKSIEKHAVK